MAGASGVVAVVHSVIREDGTPSVLCAGPARGNVDYLEDALMTSISDVLGGRYRLDQLLGRGGMSDVYQAVDLTNGRAVAVKIVRSDDPEFARRLSQEARALESFEHPGLIRLLDTGIDAQQAYLVMELIDGSTLAERLRTGALGSKTSAALGARLADALAYVHERGIVHRDVKPSNILLTSDGQAWLGDFGIARHHDASTMTVAGTTLGTVSYMAPEQLEDHQVGPAADVWSLGVVLLECLSGQRVYEGSPSEVVARRLAGPVVLPIDLPVAWRQVVSGMLHHQPSQRLLAGQVAALLNTSAFDSPWRPAEHDATTLVAPQGSPDATSLMPGVVGVAALAADQTRVTAPARRPLATPGRRRRPSRTVLGLAGLVALALALFFTFRASPVSAPRATTPFAPSTTRVLTTTAPVGSAALAKLVSDVALGQGAGTLDAHTAQEITQQASTALASFAAAQTGQAAVALQQAAAAIATGVQSGSIQPTEGATLQSDLVALASALHLSAASVPPTTVAGPGPGHGKGHGNH